MPTLCVHCFLLALAKGERPQAFSESPSEHMARYHPNGFTREDRMDLEQRVSDVAKARERHQNN